MTAFAIRLVALLLAGTGSVFASTAVTCRVVGAGPQSVATAKGAAIQAGFTDSNSLCIRNLPAALCTADEAWPIDGAISVGQASACEPADCVLDAADPDASVRCAGVSVQPSKAPASSQDRADTGS